MNMYLGLLMITLKFALGILTLLALIPLTIVIVYTHIAHGAQEQKVVTNFGDVYACQTFEDTKVLATAFSNHGMDAYRSHMLVFLQEQSEGGETKCKFYPDAEYSFVEGEWLPFDGQYLDGFQYYSIAVVQIELYEDSEVQGPSTMYTILKIPAGRSV